MPSVNSTVTITSIAVVNALSPAKSVVTAAAGAIAGLVGATPWDLMLADQKSKLVYCVELTPWALTDRS